MVPAIRVQYHVDHLQAGIGVQLRLEEHDYVETDVDDRRRPAPDILPDTQENADDAKHCSDDFYGIHCMRMDRMSGEYRRSLRAKYFPSMPFRFLQIGLLALSLGGCSILHRKPPEPINTPELPTATNEAFDSLMVDVQKVDSSV